MFNKIDTFSYIKKETDDLTPASKENSSLEELEQTWMARLNENGVFISARKRDNIERLKSVLYRRIREIHVQRFPYNDFLYQHYEDLPEESGIK